MNLSKILLTAFIGLFFLIEFSQAWSLSSLFSGDASELNTDSAVVEPDAEIESIEQEVDLEDQLDEDYDDMEEEIGQFE